MMGGFHFSFSFDFSVMVNVCLVILLHKVGVL